MSTALLYCIFAICVVLGLVLGLILSLWIAAKCQKKKTNKQPINLTIPVNTQTPPQIDVSDENIDEQVRQALSEDTHAVQLNKRIVNKSDSWSDINADITETSSSENLLLSRRKEDHAYNSIVHSRIKNIPTNTLQTQLQTTENTTLTSDVSTDPSGTANDNNVPHIDEVQSDVASQESIIVQNTDPEEHLNVDDEEEMYPFSDEDFIIPEETEIITDTNVSKPVVIPTDFVLPEPKSSSKSSKKKSQDHDEDYSPPTTEAKYEDDLFADDSILMENVAIKNNDANISKKKKKKKKKNPPDNSSEEKSTKSLNNVSPQDADNQKIKNSAQISINEKPQTDHNIQLNDTTDLTPNPNETLTELNNAAVPDKKEKNISQSSKKAKQSGSNHSQTAVISYQRIGKKRR